MKINRRIMSLISLPVSKPERLYQCGTWSIVYPPFNKLKKEQKNERSKEGIGRRWKFGVQYEPWET